MFILQHRNCAAILWPDSRLVVGTRLHSHLSHALVERSNEVGHAIKKKWLLADKLMRKREENRAQEKLLDDLVILRSLPLLYAHNS